jgi:hypothetical protein
MSCLQAVYAARCPDVHNESGVRVRAMNQSGSRCRFQFLPIRSGKRSPGNSWQIYSPNFLALANEFANFVIDGEGIRF